MQKNLFYDTCLIISYEILIRKLLGVKVINMWSYNAMFKMAIYFVERNIDKLLLSCKKKLFPEYFAEYIRWIKQIINFWFTNYVKPILWNKDKLMYFTFYIFFLKEDSIFNEKCIFRLTMFHNDLKCITLFT